MGVKKIFGRLFGRAAVVGFWGLLGYRYPNTGVTSVSSDGRETLESLITRKQNELRDPNELIKRR